MSRTRRASPRHLLEQDALALGSAWKLIRPLQVVIDVLAGRPLLGVHGVHYRRGSVPLQLAAHLPLIQFDRSPITRERILDTVKAAVGLDFWGISANDHVIFSRPWIDGPTALALAIPHAGELRICTTIAQPTIRGPLRSRRR